MRCLACDKRLNDRESTRKYATSGTFVDLCDRCFSTVSDEIPDVEGDVPDDYSETDYEDLDLNDEGFGEANYE